MTNTVKLNIINGFYDRYFSIHNFIDRKRPEEKQINRFIGVGNNRLKKDTQNLLAMFVFDFWSLAYTIKKPSKERLVEFIKRTKL